MSIQEHNHAVRHAGQAASPDLRGERLSLLPQRVPTIQKSSCSFVYPSGFAYSSHCLRAMTYPLPDYSETLSLRGFETERFPTPGLDMRVQKHLYSILVLHTDVGFEY